MKAVKSGAIEEECALRRIPLEEKTQLTISEAALVLANFSTSSDSYHVGPEEAFVEETENEKGELVRTERKAPRLIALSEETEEDRSERFRGKLALLRDLVVRRRLRLHRFEREEVVDVVALVDAVQESNHPFPPASLLSRANQIRKERAAEEQQSKERGREGNYFERAASTFRTYVLEIGKRLTSQGKLKPVIGDNCDRQVTTKSGAHVFELNRTHLLRAFSEHRAFELEGYRDRLRFEGQKHLLRTVRSDLEGYFATDKDGGYRLPFKLVVTPGRPRKKDPEFLNYERALEEVLEVQGRSVVDDSQSAPTLS